MHILLAARLLTLLAASAAAFAVLGAECRLPVPDGGEQRPTAANLSGRIASIGGRGVVVRQASTGKLVTVHIPESAEIYSAFGGDGSFTDLAKGQAVWVWFQNCKWPRNGVPVSAYFQIYSKDPNDRP